MTGRDENGRFTNGNQIANGNKGGTGRPPKTREERYLEIAIGAVPFSQWKRIVKRAADDAERGDAQARRWLSDYLLGPAAQQVNIGGGTDNKLIIEYVNDWRER